MHSSDTFGSSGSDDEDEEGGWLSQSTFALGAPPVSARHGSVERAERRPLPLSTSGFDVSHFLAVPCFVHVLKEGVLGFLRTR